MTIPPDFSSDSSLNNNDKEASSSLLSNSQYRKLSSLNSVSFQESKKPLYLQEVKSSNPWLFFIIISLMITGLMFNLPLIGLTSALVALAHSLRSMLPRFYRWFVRYLNSSERDILITLIVFILSLAGILYYIGVYQII